MEEDKEGGYEGYDCFFLAWSIIQPGNHVLSTTDTREKS
jgi:hypothetical protein